MDNQAPRTLVEHFSGITDPRIDRTKRHKLIDILAISICATICGAEGWEEFELFGNAKLGWFKSFLELPNGIPSDDTFRRVFARIDPHQFRQCFLEWVRSVYDLTRGQIVAIDGKLSRRSYDRAAGKSAINMVSAWASENQMVLGQVKVDTKSNEITAIPQLLDMLEIAGCIAFFFQLLDLTLEHFFISNAPVKALTTEDTQLDLCYIQPTPMLGRVVKL